MLCKACGSEFSARPADIKRGHGKFCGRLCANRYIAATRKRATADRFPNCLCAVCAKTFYRAPSKLAKSRSGFTFCSRECKETAQRVGGPISIPEIQPDHYGDGNTAYRDKAIRLYGASCARCGYDRFEALLQVHHKDRDRKNSRSENLEVLCIRCHHEDHLIRKDGPFAGRNSLGK